MLMGALQALLTCVSELLYYEVYTFRQLAPSVLTVSQAVCPSIRMRAKFETCIKPVQL